MIPTPENLKTKTNKQSSGLAKKGTQGTKEVLAKKEQRRFWK
jgi:hypothetical protein